MVRSQGNRRNISEKSESAMEKKICVIDTCIFIDHLRNYHPALSFFDLMLGRKDILFSAITEVELLQGNANTVQEKREMLLKYLALWKKVPVDNPLTVLAGDISRKYNVAVPDAIIAATAIINNAVLITKNVKDFNKITNLNIKEPY